MSKYSDVINALKNSRKVAVFMHINPDCDCIGSAIALSLFLRNDGKKATFFSPDLTTTDMIGDKCRFLPTFDTFNQSEDMEFDLAVAVDTGDKGRLGDTAARLFFKIKNKVVIDHHAIHEDFTPITLREADSASTTQILYKVFCEYDEKLIDKNVATALFAGLVTDSGGFSFDNCTAETFAVASKLVAYGINNSLICERLLKETPPNVYELRNRVLSGTKYYENGQIAIIVFTKKLFEETNTKEADTDGIINFVRDITGVEVAISISEAGEKKYKVSFRTKHKADAAACAKCFGGGGHVRAAGCRVNGYFESVYDKILSAAREMLQYD